MINAVRADSPGVVDGKLILRFLDDQNKRYDVALNQRAASDAFAVLLRESKNLPYIHQVTEDHPELKRVVFRSAIGPGMTPSLIMQIGGLQVAIPLPQETRDSLLSCIHELEALVNPSGLAN